MTVFFTGYIAPGLNAVDCDHHPTQGAFFGFCGDRRIRRRPLLRIFVGTSFWDFWPRFRTAVDLSLFALLATKPQRQWLWAVDARTYVAMAVLLLLFKHRRIGIDRRRDQSPVRRLVTELVP